MELTEHPPSEKALTHFQNFAVNGLSAHVTVALNPHGLNGSFLQQRLSAWGWDEYGVEKPDYLDVWLKWQTDFWDGLKGPKRVQCLLIQHPCYQPSTCSKWSPDKSWPMGLFGNRHHKIAIVEKFMFPIKLEIYGYPMPNFRRKELQTWEWEVVFIRCFPT